MDENFINLVAVLTPIVILLALDLFRANGRLNELIKDFKRDRSTKTK